MSQHRAIVLLSLFLTVGVVHCGSDDSSTAAAGASGAAGAGGTGGQTPAVGTLEVFASLDGNSEGIALGKDPDGAPALYAGAGDTVVRIGADGKVTKVTDLPKPLGMATTADGDLLVCGTGPDAVGTSDMPGVIWKVTPAGDKQVWLGPSQDGSLSFKLTNMLAIAPDNRVVFSDSGANKLYRAEADGTGVTLITDAITYPNGVAFSADGATLYVASYSDKKVWSLARKSDGGFDAPKVFADGPVNVDGITPLADGGLIFVQTGQGVVKHALDGKETQFVSGDQFLVCANGAFGEGALGSGWFYVSSLFGSDITRVYLGEKGASLPIR